MARVGRLLPRHLLLRPRSSLGVLVSGHQLGPRGGLRVDSAVDRQRTLPAPISVRSYATLLEPVKFKQVSLDQVEEEAEDVPASKLFAVVHISARQFKITTNDLIVVNRLQVADIGDEIFLEKVLLVGSEKFTLIGNPLLSKETVRVMATVVEHSRAAKVIVFKKKRRKNYKRKRGHRQDVTVLRINNIELANRSHSGL